MSLEVLGELYVNLSHTTCIQKVKESSQLAHMVESNGDEILTKYPSLLTSLGTFPDAYSIKLHPDAQPYAKKHSSSTMPEDSN